MLAKPFNLALVYIVTVFNMAILSSPLLALLIPFIERRGAVFELSGEIFEKFKLAIFLVIFAVSFFILCYLLLDLMFGFAMRASLKKCKNYKKLKGYEFLDEIFSQVKEKFAQNNVKLYIKNSDEINAFAVASMGGKAIILTSKMVDHYLKNSNNSQEFICAIRSILSHEMSHLVNKDFLPAYLIMANRKATNFVSILLDIIFMFAARALYKTPYGGKTASRYMVHICVILNFIFGAFNRFIVSNIYSFLAKFVSRNLEYRCDRQAAFAFGGRNMAHALSYLGKSGYFTLFSTHPATQKRIKKVQNIEEKDGVIRPNFIDSISNYLAIFFLIAVSIFFAKKAEINLLIQEFLRNHEIIYQKLTALIELISRFF